MSDEQNNQPAAEGSAPEMVKEGPLGDGMDAKPAAEPMKIDEPASSVKSASKIDDAVAGGDLSEIGNACKDAVRSFLGHARKEAKLEVKAVPSLAEIEALIEKAASMYGVPHDGDHESTAKKLAAYMGHAVDDLETLIGKLRQHAGL